MKPFDIMRSVFQLRSAVLLIALFFGCAGVMAAEEEGADVWIFAGQSNMHPGAQFGGFEAQLKEALPDIKLALIGNRRSGNPIDSWDPKAESGGPGWTEIVDQVDKLEDKSRIAGFVWYQGESDADSRERATAYERKLNDLIARVRKYVGKPELPAIIVQIASAQRSGAGQWATGYVREASRRVAETDPHAELVTAIDLRIGDITVHIDGPAKTEIGRRQGLAALSLVYGQGGATHGPQFNRATFADKDRRVVVVEFKGVRGSLKLEDGWQQAFSVLRDIGFPEEISEWPDPKEIVPIEQALENPIYGEIVAPDKVALVFAKPVGSEDRLGWAVTPNAMYGEYRKWQMEFSGVTDETGIVAAAFGPVDVEGESTEDIDLKKLISKGDDAAGNKVDASKPFQIAVNCVGRFPEGITEPEAEAGYTNDGWRQSYWNPVSGGPIGHLFDSKGHVLPIGFSSGVWYMSPYFREIEHGDDALMASWNKHSLHSFTGLKPGASYDLAVYLLQGPPNKKGVEAADFRDVKVSVWDIPEGKNRNHGKVIAERVISVPARGTFDEYQLAGDGEGSRGNLAVFKSLIANDQGKIEFTVQSPWEKDDGTLKWGDTTLAGVQIRPSN